MNIKPKLTTLFILTSLLLGCTSTPMYSPDTPLVVVAHGLGRSDFAMRGLKNSLADAGYAVCRLNYSSIGQSLQKWKEETTSQIDQCVSGYSTVHFVGHSLGGLAIRSYLANDEQLAQDKRLGKVVLLGTPNKGSEVADSMKGHFLMSIAGEVSQSLTTGEQSLGQRLPPPYYPVGVIAGTSESSGTAELFHSLNDGLVSVESAKVSNMADFITLDVSHTAMRYDAEVAKQTISYLQTGHFIH
ncbi:alpha/beta hydrolase [Vibrio coralliilyticus]|uniref:alpha/beta fold hydrolase n=1 Tax=Vibrio coralliilyticus TaxID=190893 RepID=UPI00148E876E|nr:alpha/beta fold hydrolase [Vibrio coralliilyticus]NOH51704.1 alpha/beta hydrolase [Vibrio coralliilyticus]